MALFLSNDWLFQSEGKKNINFLGRESKSYYQSPSTILKRIWRISVSFMRTKHIILHTGKWHCVPLTKIHINLYVRPYCLTLHLENDSPGISKLKHAMITKSMALMASNIPEKFTKWKRYQRMHFILLHIVYCKSCLLFKVHEYLAHHHKEASLHINNLEREKLSEWKSFKLKSWQHFSQAVDFRQYFFMCARTRPCYARVRRDVAGKKKLLPKKSAPSRSFFCLLEHRFLKLEWVINEIWRRLEKSFIFYSVYTQLHWKIFSFERNQI